MVLIHFKALVKTHVVIKHGAAILAAILAVKMEGHTKLKAIVQLPAKNLLTQAVVVAEKYAKDLLHIAVIQMVLHFVHLSHVVKRKDVTI
ncbi:MAG: hypothetical protein COY80_02595 [Candidatus Pacebacteria bacterium CG_4_10_14_0_8_um_filter_42_14]|nr:MAG: hypothetical protein COY80_02595 [Candidatus Pacebacteria bacterium CG_4_10_14_0_8_um_filter_42_14]